MAIFGCHGLLDGEHEIEELWLVDVVLKAELVIIFKNPLVRPVGLLVWQYSSVIVNLDELGLRGLLRLLLRCLGLLLGALARRLWRMLNEGDWLLLLPLVEEHVR